MFSTFLAGLGGYFDKRWLLSMFFPSLAFWGMLLLVVAVVRGLNASLLFWNNQPAKLQTVSLVVGLSGVAFFAYVLSNFQTELTRFFEGYWRLPILTWIAGKRRAFYQRRFLYLKEQTQRLAERRTSLSEALRNPNDARHQEALEVSQNLSVLERQFLLFYPFEEDRVMPSRLGNIIRAAEYYALGRYNIDAVVIWPRLYPYLPESFVNDLSSARTDMTFMLVLSALSFIFGLVTCIPLALFSNHWLLFLACALAFPLAGLCYLNSLGGASLYGELIKTAFDLHRWKLLEAFHIKYPETYEAELVTWDELNHLIYRNEAPEVNYDVKKSPAEGAAKPKEKNELNLWVGFVTGQPQTSENQPVEGAPANSPRIAPEPERPATPAPAATPPNQTPSAAELQLPKDSLGFIYFGIVIVFCVALTPIMASRQAASIDLPVMASDVSSYHLIKAEDVKHQTVAKGTVSEGTITDEKLIVGYYSLQPLSRDNPVQRTQIHELNDPQRLNNCVIACIPATPAMLLGGALKPGDVVTIGFVKDNAAPPVANSIENVVVLDVKTLPEKPATADKPVEQQFVIVMAIPTSVIQQVREGSARGSLWISRSFE